MIFGPVITQVLGKNTLRGKTYQSFLLPCVGNPGSPRFTLRARLLLAVAGLGLRPAVWRRRGERHAQVSAYDIDDGLAVCGVGLSEPFECVQAAGPGRSLVAAELLNRRGVELGGARLGRVKVVQNYGELLVVAAEGPSAMRELHGKHHLAARVSIAGGQPGRAAAHASARAAAASGRFQKAQYRCLVAER